MPRCVNILNTIQFASIAIISTSVVWSWLWQRIKFYLNDVRDSFILAGSYLSEEMGITQLALINLSQKHTYHIPSLTNSLEYFYGAFPLAILATPSQATQRWFAFPSSVQPCWSRATPHWSRAEPRPNGLPSEQGQSESSPGLCDVSPTAANPRRLPPSKRCVFLDSPPVYAGDQRKRPF